jgi:hypothetical protein
VLHLVALSLSTIESERIHILLFTCKIKKKRKRNNKREGRNTMDGHYTINAQTVTTTDRIRPTTVIAMVFTTDYCYLM